VVAEAAASEFPLDETGRAGFEANMQLHASKNQGYRSDAVVAEEQRQLRQMVRQMSKDPAKMRSFLIEGGFITKSGKLSKRYGG
jgi:hypothetical protein